MEKGAPNDGAPFSILYQGGDAGARGSSGVRRSRLKRHQADGRRTVHVVRNPPRIL
jgi:hypothetical protein